jgi:Holliday junction DNA helicase RuvA
MICYDGVMISYLRGTIIDKTPRFIVVEVGGIGDRVFCSEKMLVKMEVGKEKEIYTMLFVRDDALELYGFDGKDQLEVFELLLNVSGIGPRAAQAISGVGSANEILGAIEKGDEKFFAGIAGVGSKKIKKVILELSGKLPKRDAGKLEQTPFRDAHRALVSLGFSAEDSKEVLENVPQDLTDSKEIVRKALKLLGKAI